jgi:hypothetical protein
MRTGAFLLFAIVTVFGFVFASGFGSAQDRSGSAGGMIGKQGQSASRTDELPAEYAALIGKWEGHWKKSGRPRGLVVESVTHSGVVSGTYTFARDGKNEEVRRFRGKFENGFLKWGDPVNDVGYEFKLEAGKLIGERYEFGAQAGSIVMTKTR